RGGVGGGAEGAVALRVGGGGRLRRVGDQRLPAGRLLAVEAERFGHVVDGRLALVGEIGVLRDPEEIRRDQARERGTILLSGDLAELLAESVEGRIVQRRRQRDRNRLVGTGR